MKTLRLLSLVPAFVLSIASAMVGCGGDSSSDNGPAGGSGGAAGSGGIGGLGGAGGTDGGFAHACKDPKPILVNGQPTGLESCGMSAAKRTESTTCPEMMPRASACTATQMDCTTDADCTAAPHGYCAFSAAGFMQPSVCGCRYGCTQDSECPQGQACLCGEPTGQCVLADCATSADCGSGFDCVTAYGDCTGKQLHCQQPADECGSADDCPNGYCGVGPQGNFVCLGSGCGAAGG